MFDAVFEVLSYLIILFMLVVFFMYPLWIGVALYCVAYFVCRYLMKKRNIEMPFVKMNAIFLIGATLATFLIGLISFDIEEILAWNIIPGVMSYLAGVGVYNLVYDLMKFTHRKKEADIDDASLRGRKRISKLVAVVAAVIVFIVCEMIGVSFVAMTLM